MRVSIARVRERDPTTRRWLKKTGKGGREERGRLCECEEERKEKGGGERRGRRGAEVPRGGSNPQALQAEQVTLQENEV